MADDRRDDLSGELPRAQERSGGRGADPVGPSDALAEGQAEHQDRSQSVAASESGRD